MRFKVTCTACRKPFGVESTPGREVRCVCPFCGKEMVVSLPKVDTSLSENDSTSLTENGKRRTENIPSRSTAQSAKQPKGSSGCLKTLVLFLLLVAGGIGAYLYFDYTQQRMKRTEQAQKSAEQKAHQEELLRERERQRLEWVETPATQYEEDDETADSPNDETTNFPKDQTKNHITHETDKDSL